MDLAGLKVIVEKKGQKKEDYDFGGFDRNQLFVDEIDNFFNCIINRSQPVVTLEDGVNSLKIAIAVRQSIETGQIIIPTLTECR